MPILKKTLFDEHLEKYNVLVNDIQSDSEYFKITELPDTFTGGKNAFLIQGSAQLVADTLVKIQIRDAKGKIIYYEPGMGIPQYYEGTSKVIAVYIYPDTAFGPCTITILGELSEYVDSNGIAQPVPQNWQGTYNVKWTKTVNVNPRLANTTKVRFYKRPKIAISETILPIYTRTTNIITISGSMNGTAINPNAGVDYSTFNDVLQYQITLTDGTNFSSSMVGETYTINGLSASYTPTITQVLTNKTALVNIPYYTTSSVNPSYQNVQSFISGAYTASFIQTVTVVSSNVSSSYASIDITDLDAFTGNPKRIKVYASSLSDTANFSLLEDVPLEASQIFLTSSFNGALNVPTGYLSPSILSSFWNYFNINATANVTQDNNTLYQSAVLKPSTDFSSSLGLIGFYYNKQIPFTKNTEYELDYTPLLSASAGFGGLSIYASGSAFLNTNSSLPYGKLIGSLTSNQSFYRYNAQKLNFKPDNDGTGSILFVVNGGTWQLANLSLAAAQDTAFSPNEVKLTVNVPTKIANETYDFKFEVYDVNNNFVPVSLNENFTFVGGNDSISYVITNVSSSISSSFGPLSSSFSGSLAKVSASISGTITYNSSSVSSSIVTLSGSVSGSIVTLSGSVSSSISSSLSSSFNYTSGSVYTLSGSVSSSQSALSASISRSVYNSLTQSFTYVQSLANGNYSGSFISGNIIYAPVIGGQLGYFSTLFKVGQSPNSIYLDARQTPRKIFIGGVIPSGDTEYSGAYNNTNTNVYLDSAGKFSLGNQLSFDGSNLTVNGTINVAGGNAATNTSLTSSLSSTLSSANSTAAGYATNAAASASASGSTNPSTQAITKAAAPSGAGLYLGSNYLGYYNGSGWKTYLANNGDFYLSGTSGTNGLSWVASTNTLSIDGAITARSGYIGNGSSGFTINNTYIGNGKTTLTDANAGVYVGTDGISLGANSTFKVDSSGNLTATSATISGTITITNPSTANNGNPVGTFSNGNALTAGTIGGVSISSSKIYIGTGTFANTNTAFYVDNTGQFSLKDQLYWDGSILTINGAASIGGSAVSSVVSNANAALQPGSNVTQLTNNAGYQNNSSDKTAGTVGGWTIGSSTIASNSGQTVLNNTGLIQLKNSGGTEKIRLTYDTLTEQTATNSGQTFYVQSTDNNFSSTAGSLQYYLSAGSNVDGGTQTLSSFVAPSSGNATFIVNYPDWRALNINSQPNVIAYYSNGTNKVAVARSYATITATLCDSDGNSLASALTTFWTSTFPISPGSNQFIAGYGSGTAAVNFNYSVISGTTYIVKIQIQTNSYANAYYNGSYVTGTLSGTVYSWGTMNNQTCGLTIISEKLQIGINGLSVGNDAGQYAAIGTVAGSGLVGNFIGNVTIAGTLTAGSAQGSDRRLKTNIQTISNALDKIDSLNPVSYDWNKSMNQSETRDKGYGFIADEVQEVFPELIQIAKIGNIDDAKTIEYSALHGLQVAAIKQLIQKTTLLENKILELENKISSSI